MATNTTPKKKKFDGRTSDLTLQWLVNNHGKQWETWRQLAEEWINTQNSATSTKLDVLCIFLRFTYVALCLLHRTL